MKERFWGGGVSSRFFYRDRWANFELAAVLVLAAGKFVIGDLLGLHVWFAVAAGILGIVYIASRLRHTPGLIESWGFSRSNLKVTFAIVIPITALAVAAALWYGLASGKAIFHWHMIPVLLLYPAWGTGQQFLLVVLVAGNLDRITRGHLSRFFVVLCTALLFSLLHIPVPTLMLITFFMGGFTTALFLRYRSIWALGLFHGLFATGIYYFVLGEDPLRGFLHFLG